MKLVVQDLSFAARAGWAKGPAKPKCSVSEVGNITRTNRTTGLRTATHGHVHIHHVLQVSKALDRPTGA